MARTHGRILTSIWLNPHFVALPSDAQHMYFALVTQPRLSYAGVLDYMPRRLAAIAPDLTGPKVDRAVRRLIAEPGRFLVMDEDTSELLIRTYIKHDGVMNKKNVGKAMASAFDRITSPHLRDVIVTELQKLYPDTSGQQGWGGVQEINPRLFALAQGLGHGLDQAVDQ